MIRPTTLSLSGLRLDDGLGEARTVLHDDPLLCAGFHKPEPDHRWTAGRARLPAALLANLEGLVFLRLDLGPHKLARWTAPGMAAAAEAEVPAGLRA